MGTPNRSEVHGQPHDLAGSHSQLCIVERHGIRTLYPFLQLRSNIASAVSRVF